MLRAGEGIVINYDGTGGEIAVSGAQWFVAEITGTVAGSSPVNHKWKKKVPQRDGKTYEDANPPVIGDGISNPAYLPALTSGNTSSASAMGLVFMRLRSTNAEGQCVYEIIGAAGGGAGIVSNVQCVGSVLRVTYAGGNGI